MPKAEVPVMSMELKTVNCVAGRVILGSNGVGTLNCITEGVDPRKGSDFCHTIQLEPEETAEAFSILQEQGWTEKVMASRKFFGGKGSITEQAEDAALAATEKDA